MMPGMNSSLAKAFRWTGRTGFWAQVGIGVLSLIVGASAFIYDRTVAGVGTRGALAAVQYLTIVSLMILAFTTFWSYRYMLIAEQIADADRRPARGALKKTVWTGVAATALGLVFSMLIMLFESVQLFVYFLRAPQAGVPVVQTTAGPTNFVSAGDILSLAAIIAVAFVEVVVLVLGVWLLFRTVASSAEFPHSEYDD